jgi:hypothetical protein
VAGDKGSHLLTASETPPFSTREPDCYQAVRTITSSETGSSQSRITKIKIARDGSMRREEYETAPGDSLVYLEIPAGRFVLLPSARLMADLNETSPSSPVELPLQVADGDLSTDRLLNQIAVETRYQPLGSETVKGRNATKYRVLTSAAVNTDGASSETLMWIDDVLKMPVRWEISASGGERQTRTVMELSEISLVVDAGTFVLPPDYRRVNSRSLSDSMGRNNPGAKTTGGRN